MGLKIASTLAIVTLIGIFFSFTFFIGIWFMSGTIWGLFLMIIIDLVILLVQYAISPYIIQWIYNIEWISYEEYQTRFPYLAEIVNKVVSYNHIKMPKLGIIHDGNPNAFTFGHTKNSARIVITTGILEYLNKKEQQGVLAHELGHVVHSDFILMTLILAIPLVFLSVARWAYYSVLFSRSSGDRDDAAQRTIIFIAILVLSYIAYYIGYITSLFISRVREYYADQHAAEVLENPNALSTGLVKIAYGLVADQGITIKQRNRSKTRALRGLGIFDPNTARYFASEGLSPTGSYSNETIAAAAAWDLFNPWARYYQIRSTHPLPAKRIKRLNQQCPKYGIEPEIDLSKAREIKKAQAGKSMMGEFLTDVFFKLLPFIVFIMFLTFTVFWLINSFAVLTLPFFGAISLNQLLLLWGIGFYIIGFGFIAKTKFKYSGGFEPKTVLELVTNVKVSPIRSIPAIIEGKIIGKGVPGYYLSDDLYFQDKTGLLYVDYRFGISIVDFFWAIARAGRLVGQRVKIKGWYRRGPNPYIQVDTIETSSGRRFRNYTKHFTYIYPVICFIIGIVFFYFWLTLKI